MQIPSKKKIQRRSNMDDSGGYSYACCVLGVCITVSLSTLFLYIVFLIVDLIKNTFDKCHQQNYQSIEIFSFNRAIHWPMPDASSAPCC